MRIALLIYLITNFFGTVSSTSQQIVEGPTDTSALLGETVLLKCRVENQVGAVQWTKNGFGLGLDRNLTFHKNYRMEGSQSKGEYHLRIFKASISDDATYQCSMAATNKCQAVHSREAKLSVIVEPEPPLFPELSSELRTNANYPLEVSCESRNGKPASQINWALYNQKGLVKQWIWLGNETFSSKTQEFDNTKQSIRDEAKVSEKTFRTREGKYTVISNVTFIPKPEDDGSYLTCLVDHLSYSKLQTTNIKLDVNYAPIVTLSLVNTSKLSEGHSAVLHCNAKAKPVRGLRFYWYKNGTKVGLAKTNQFIIPKLRVENHQEEIRCEVENSVGNSSAALALDVSYAPRFISSIKEFETKLNETARFHCDAVGNPEPELIWKKTGSDEIIGLGNDMVFKFTNNWERGEYECIANADGFAPIRQKYYLHLVGAPSLSLTENIHASIGENVELICEIHNKPFPYNVTWFLNGRPIPGFGKPITVIKKYAVESRYSFNLTKNDQFGKYTCTATNSLGSASESTEVKQKSMLLGVFPFYYVLPVFFVFLSICGMLVCYAIMRCRKNLYKNSTRFNDEQSDVTVKCETLDGTQFFADMYTPPQIEGRDLHFSKDYVSVPQSNPDLDYIQTSEYVSGYSPRSNCILDYPVDEHNRFDQPYCTFTINTSSAGDPIVDMYGYSNMKVENSLLEPVTEVTTPDIVTAPGLMVNGTKIIERPVSRLSTHV